MSKFVLGLAFCIVYISFCHAGDVLQLTDSDFDSQLAGADLALVKFYAPWCGHCKKIAPEFEKAATVLKYNDPPVTLAEVDCTAEGKEMCSKHGVSGYPTLKVFKNGEKAFEYEGPRESDGIVKYMRGKAGPSSKVLTTVAEAEKFLASPEHSVLGFFTDGESEISKQFKKLADSMSDDVRFAQTVNSEVSAKYGYSDVIVLFRPERLQTKLEPSRIVFDGDYKILYKLKDWVNDNLHGLVGHRTASNVGQFKNPLFIVYYDVDYVKNAKGTNYWRNRVMKVAQKFAEAGKKLNFAVSAANEFGQETAELGLTFSSEKGVPVVGARNADDQKFAMKTDFSVDALEQFVNDVLDGKLKPYLKSEPIPESNDGPVKVVVAENFDEIVNDETKDVLIEFYAPWCGHCKTLAPKYDELGEKLKKEDGIVIAKMDATANDVPKQYEVRGFPTIFFAPKGSKKNPKKYEGEREVDAFIKYIAREASTPLTTYDRSGKKTKAKKVDL